MKYRFFSKIEYFDELVRRLGEAMPGDRVALVTMQLRPTENGVAPVLAAMAAAARRGVKVNFFYDAYTFLVGDNGRLGPLFYRHHLPAKLTKTFHQRQTTIQTLSDSGVICVMVNRPAKLFKNPYAGRMHIKLALIGDRFFVGGCNLSSTKSNDLMVSLKSATAVKRLWAILTKLQATGNVKAALGNQDLLLKVEDKYSLLIDRGQPGQSNIYTASIGLVDDAKRSVVGAFYFFPRGLLALALRQAARRSVNITVFINRRFIHEMPHKLIQPIVGGIGQLRLGKYIHFRSVPRGNILHAKLITADNATILGSHNFDVRGVRWGTAEIAVLSTDPEFGKAALLTLEEQLKK